MARTYDVPLFPQSTGMSCWAASIAMILGWKNQQCIADVTIAANHGGQNYLPSLSSGLDPNDRYILERNGFELDAPQCYTLAGVQNLLETRGPLWVACAVPSAHIRVVRGYDGARLHVNDPAPVNVGSQYTRAFREVFGRMEALGERERSEPAPVYVAYLRG